MRLPRPSPALALAALLLGASAQAQPARDEARKPEAAALVARAQQACAGGNHAGALSVLSDAAQIYPHPRIRYRTGIEQQHLGLMVEAMDTLERYLADPEREPEYAADAAARVASMRPGVGEVNIVGEPGLNVQVDGHPRGNTPLPRVRLAAGPHIVSVVRRGFVPFETTVQVVGGRTAWVQARLQPQTAGGSEPGWLAEPTDLSRAPAELGLLMSGGIWISGPVDPLPTLGAVVGGSYRLFGDRLSAHLGPRLTVNTIRDLEVTVLALGLVAAPMVRLALVPERLSASLEVGAGLLVLSGLRPHSLLLIEQADKVTGALSTFTVRPALTFEYQINGDLALLTAMAAVWSPRPDPAFRQRSLVHFDLGLGLSWAF